MPLLPLERERLRSTLGTKCHCVWTGELLEITYLPVNREYRLPGRRGAIKGFTPSARLRMMRTVASVNWERVKASLFITLTYPDEVAERTCSMRTQDRYVFFRSMENYLCKEVGALWRLEWKPRRSGANKGRLFPHVHLIVFGVGFLPWQDIRQWWRSALNVKGSLATDVQRIKGGKVVAKYVTKYCSKPMEVDSLDNASYSNKLGRHWGIHRRSLIPFCNRWVIPFLDGDDIQLAENAGCQVFKYFTRNAGQGFSLLGPLAEKVGQELFCRMLDKEKRFA